MAPYRPKSLDAGCPAALSQVGTPSPVDGRKIGVVVDAMSESGLAAAVVDAVREARMMPFVGGPHGGMVDELTVARTYATARSYEFDALVVVGVLGAAVIAEGAPGVVIEPGGQQSWQASPSCSRCTACGTASPRSPPEARGGPLSTELDDHGAAAARCGGGPEGAVSGQRLTTGHADRLTGDVAGLL